MKSLKFRPRRYRLKEVTAQAVRSGHPWVFRNKISQAADKFCDGQWLELLDPKEKIVGYGIYQKEGGVAIRMLRDGSAPPDRSYIDKLVRRAVRKRSALSEETDAFRALNGENDGLPGVVLDVYGKYGVLQTYHPSVDALGRYAAAIAAPLLGLEGVVWKVPQKRIGDRKEGVRVLRGQPPERIVFREGSLELCADLLSGQKSGTFLDLRGLRRWLREQDLKGKRVLNLFAYTGMLGLACCLAGAREVVNVDAAQASLDFGAAHHGHPAQSWLQADIFPWLKTLSDKEKFDLIIVDPPSMASLKEQVPKALATYARIYRSLVPHLKPGGQMVGCCCTSRISPEQFEQCLKPVLRPLKIVKRIAMEVDHKPRYAEANYLKVVIAK